MNNAGDSGKFSDSQGWLEPFRVFFDRSFPGVFSSALELVENDEGIAAQLCARAFGKAYWRWSLLGRVGDPDAYVRRHVRRSARRADYPPLTLDVGIGFKPWVYVSAIESGSARIRAVRAVSGVGATAAILVLTIPALNQAPENDVESIRTGSGSTATTTTITTAVPSTIPATPALSIPTTTPSPVGPVLDAEATEQATNESERTGFTLDLSSLPTSPDEISSFNVAGSNGLSE